MAAFEIPASLGFQSKKFDIGMAQALTPTGTAGFIQTIDRTSPFWFAEYTTPPLVGAAYNDARAFLDSLEGSKFTFLGYDPRRIRPYAYLANTAEVAPWGVGAQLTAQNYAASTVTLSGLTNGRLITKGDYVSCQIAGIWYLFRSMQNVTIGGTGIVELVVKPRPQIINLVASNLRQSYPVAEFKVIGAIEEEDDVSSFPTFRFRAGQFINRAGV